MAWNTVVAGGGFAGLYAVRALERRLPRHSAKISIVSRVELPPLLAAAVDLADDRRVGAAELMLARRMLQLSVWDVPRPRSNGSERLGCRLLRACVGRAPSALDQPPLTPAPPRRSRCLREIDRRSRRSSGGGAWSATVLATARAGKAASCSWRRAGADVRGAGDLLRRQRANRAVLRQSRRVLIACGQHRVCKPVLGADHRDAVRLQLNPVVAGKLFHLLGVEVG
jgi:hypothetical protein